ncbi:hypothetical protein FH972_021077 [Carpinus fangiana]|uniref:Protein BIG1 n=1 Tax=Carpinus fangiana TaxID=176857 RepID=A0A5N6KNA7_9ROSI|nr:hypothetical protein FH972_021077 [Carpinus fangiana]
MTKPSVRLGGLAQAVAISWDVGERHFRGGITFPHSRMRPTRLWALSLCAVLADAQFQDTSPFFALTTSSSSESFSDLPTGLEIVPGTKLALALDGVARGCAADTYILVTQPGVSAKDFSTKGAAPHLSRRLGFSPSIEEKHTTFKSIIPEVVGLVDSTLLRKRLQTTCQATLSYLDYASGEISPPEKADTPAILGLDFPELPSVAHPKARAAKLAEHDSYLNSLIEHLSSDSYTLVITTSPIPHKNNTPSVSKGKVEKAQNLPHEHGDLAYNTDSETQHFPLSALHTDLKRQLNTKRQDEPEGDDYDTRALFEKYSFFSPAIFMGIIVVILLVSVLSVGVSAISGLQVTYGSFTKDVVQGNKK